MNKKRGNGEGSITFHKASNRYMAQYTTLEGQRKTMYQRKNESLTEFKKRFTKTINDVNQGTYIEKNSKTFIEIIKEYIQKQLQEDIAYDQISISEYVDPFTGEKIEKRKR